MIDDVACSHPHTEPVTLITGEIVAKMCTACLARLDFRHGCPDCQWEDIHVLEQVAPIATVLVHDCGAHYSAHAMA